jgi:DNA-3-methyladenine glycosylase II
MQEAILHLSKDKIFKTILNKSIDRDLSETKDLYHSLLRAITGQQLSIKAASTIWNRFLDVFEDRNPDEKLLVEMDVEILRAAGLSYQKAGYLKNIAQFHLDVNLNNSKLKKMSDNDLISYLTKIKGVGTWTVQMLLMFDFGRKDVFPIDDLGIQNAIKKLYKLSETGKDLKIKMHTISKKWTPHRSIACFYLWDWKDGK